MPTSQRNTQILVHRNRCDYLIGGECYCETYQKVVTVIASCPFCTKEAVVPKTDEDLDVGTFWIWKAGAESKQEALTCEYCERFVARRPNSNEDWVWETRDL